MVALLEEQNKWLWPLARVTRVMPDENGHVRFADVVLLKMEQTVKPEQLYDIKLRSRHISKLMLLLPDKCPTPLPGQGPSESSNSSLESK